MERRTSTDSEPSLLSRALPRAPVIDTRPKRDPDRRAAGAGALPGRTGSHLWEVDPRIILASLEQDVARADQAALKVGGYLCYNGDLNAPGTACPALV